MELMPKCFLNKIPGRYIAFLHIHPQFEADWEVLRGEVRTEKAGQEETQVAVVGEGGTERKVGN